MSHCISCSKQLIPTKDLTWLILVRLINRLCVYVSVVLLFGCSKQAAADHDDNSIEIIKAQFPKMDKPVSEWAAMVLNFLNRLKQIDSALFGTWFQQAYSKKKALNMPVEFDVGFIAKLVIKEWDKKLPALGSHFAFWTGKEDESKNAMISFGIGRTSKNENIVNTVSVRLPADRNVGKLSDTQLKQITSALKEIWGATVVEIE